MDKPEYCWIGSPKDIGIAHVDIWNATERCIGDTKWRITYNEAGEPVKLERVEG